MIPVASIEPYIAIGATILFVLVVCVAQLILAHAIRPRIFHGPTKDSPYESGVPLAESVQRRFNVRFYLVAMLFLLFDVEVVFLWPWARVFHHAATNDAMIPTDGGVAVGKGFLLIGMGIFFALLVFGLFYEWKRGALEWD